MIELAADAQHHPSIGPSLELHNEPLLRNHANHPNRRRALRVGNLAHLRDKRV
jgi:hypothetical protein